MKLIEALLAVLGFACLTDIALFFTQPWILKDERATYIWEHVTERHKGSLDACKHPNCVSLRNRLQEPLELATR